MIHCKTQGLSAKTIKSYEKDNRSEDILKYVYELISYNKDLNNDIKILFSNLKVNASWADIHGNMQKENYLLSDTISFTE